MKEINKSNPFSAIIGFIARYNLIIFIIVIVSGLSFAVIVIKDIVQQTYDDSSYSSTNNEIKFDEATIQKINQLHDSQSNLNSSTSRPERVNIFAE